MIGLMVPNFVFAAEQRYIDGILYDIETSYKESFLIVPAGESTSWRTSHFDMLEYEIHVDGGRNHDIIFSLYDSQGREIGETGRVINYFEDTISLSDTKFNNFQTNEDFIFYFDNSFSIVSDKQIKLKLKYTNFYPAQQSSQQQSSSSEGGGCLIATATFGSEMAPQVQFLREIRANTVMSTQSGTAFMTGFNQFYYSFSPYVADYERENPVFKEIVKVTLTPMLTSLTLLNYVDVDTEEEMLGYGISLILLNIGMYFVAPAAAIIAIKNKLRK